MSTITQRIALSLRAHDIPANSPLVPSSASSAAVLSERACSHCKSSFSRSSTTRSQTPCAACNCCCGDSSNYSQSSLCVRCVRKIVLPDSPPSTLTVCYGCFHRAERRFYESEVHQAEEKRRKLYRETKTPDDVVCIVIDPILALQADNVDDDSPAVLEALKRSDAVGVKKCFGCNTRLFALMAPKHKPRCTVCLESFCKKCLSQVEVWLSFSKNGNSEKITVCNECRFEILGGTPFVTTQKSLSVMPIVREREKILNQKGKLQKLYADPTSGGHNSESNQSVSDQSVWSKQSAVSRSSEKSAATSATKKSKSASTNRSKKTVSKKKKPKPDKALVGDESFEDIPPPPPPEPAEDEFMFVVPPPPSLFSDVPLHPVPQSHASPYFIQKQRKLSIVPDELALEHDQQEQQADLPVVAYRFVKSVRRVSTPDERDVASVLDELEDEVVQEQDDEDAAACLAKTVDQDQLEVLPMLETLNIVNAEDVPASEIELEVNDPLLAESFRIPEIPIVRVSPALLQGLLLQQKWAQQEPNDEEDDYDDNDVKDANAIDDQEQEDEQTASATYPHVKGLAESTVGIAALEKKTEKSKYFSPVNS
eukprot:TRINITY_DN15044_c0_g1_i1.p1 TRINITY_DN15044_c0_g1~~TRINITY_DN15044_c0_g1_i1.p1  ORF type:complete len:595 (+),score=150.46 TRINITY_DN15044_c0_g1_i1:2440-4224(+)